MTKRVVNAGYEILAVWENRVETREAIAARVLAMIEELKRLDPVFKDWFAVKWASRKKKDPMVKLEEIQDRLAEELLALKRKESTGVEIEVKGYGIQIYTCHEILARAFAFEVRAGAKESRALANYLSFATYHGRIETRLAPDPMILAYDLFKPALLSVVKAWDPTLCSGRPYSLGPKVGQHELFPLAWIQYLSPWLAPLVTPPELAIVEHLPNGGLLMAATREIFDVNNEDHVDVALDILAALEPVRSIDWEKRARGPA
jgi:hypothetical protein